MLHSLVTEYDDVIKTQSTLNTHGHLSHKLKSPIGNVDLGANLDVTNIGTNLKDRQVAHHSHHSCVLKAKQVTSFG